jgi:hypothetical protein
MKPIAFVFALAAGACAFQTPYLISAAALSDSSIRITWRNNDAASQGYVLLRKSGNEQAFIFLDSVKDAGTNTFIDTPLADSTMYYYRMYAYTADSVSDTSNAQSATTPKKVFVPIFNAPGMNVAWDNFGPSNFVRVNIYDGSNCEDGFAVYRSDGFGAFHPMKKTTSATPADMNQSISWTDSTVARNIWYAYKAAAIRGTDTLFSNIDTVYTFRPPSPSYLVQFQKIGNYPVNYGEGPAGIWGDSLILKENPAPAGSYTVINIKDKQNPAFAGYVDSTQLIAYPLKSLFPVCLGLGVYNSYYDRQTVMWNDTSVFLGKYCDNKIVLWDNRLLVLKNQVLFLYEMEGEKLMLKDSLRVGYGRMIPALGDGLVLIERPGDYSLRVLPVRINSSGLQALHATANHWGYSMQCGTAMITNGFYNGSLYISSAQWCIGIGPGSTNRQNRQTRIINYAGDTPDFTVFNLGLASGSNSGLLLSSYVTLFLETINAEPTLYGIDIRNPKSLDSSIACKLGYSDTVSTVSGNPIQNIVVDTDSKTLYLIRLKNLSIIGYSILIDTLSTGIHHPNTVHYKQPLPAIKCYTANGIIRIETTGRSIKASLFDASGRMIDRAEFQKCAIALWKLKAPLNGIYFIRVESEGKSGTTKFLSIKK